MDWQDLQVATERGNTAYTTQQLLGHLSIALERDLRATPAPAPHGYNADASLAGRAVSMLERIWERYEHQRRGRDTGDLPEVVRLAEDVLERVLALFRRSGALDPYHVLAEHRFHEAAEAVCQDNGVSLPGSYLGGRFNDNEKLDPETARQRIHQDRARRARFEALSHEDWLRESAHTRSQRVAWRPTAETWAKLAFALHQALPSTPPRFLEGDDAQSWLTHRAEASVEP